MATTATTATTNGAFKEYNRTPSAYEKVLPGLPGKSLGVGLKLALDSKPLGDFHHTTLSQTRRHEHTKNT